MTRMSMVAPPRCLPTEKTWLETETVPFTETVRLTLARVLGR